MIIGGSKSENRNSAAFELLRLDFVLQQVGDGEVLTLYSQWVSEATRKGQERRNQGER